MPDWLTQHSTVMGLMGLMGLMITRFYVGVKKPLT